MNRGKKYIYERWVETTKIWWPRDKNTHYSLFKRANYEGNINESWNSDTIYFGKKGFKFFIEYNNNKLMRPLIDLLEKLRAYIKSFEEPKYTLSLNKDEDFLGN